MNHKVAVIGIGYVGLPLAVAAAKSGHEVIGIDLDISKVKKVNSGFSSTEDISDTQVGHLVSSGLLRASTSYLDAQEADVILLCVPTPLKNNKLPDLSFVESAAKSLSLVVSNSSIVILESTVAPGTTRNFLAPIFFSAPNIGEFGIEIAFSPERIDPSNSKWNIENTPKIIAGLTNQSRKRAYDFYSKFINAVIECDSLEIAETAKLLENSFRLVNISFINEIAIYCQKMKIDVNKVISAASTKPYGFLPFYPSLGAGGHCIPVDPIYLATANRDLGLSSRLIELAAQINQDMPEFFATRAEEILGGLKGKRILVIGVSYKPNVSDVRETPVEGLINILKQKGAHVVWHDDLVKVWNTEKSVSLSSDYDLAILATPHDYLNLKKLGSVPILDTRGSV